MHSDQKKPMKLILYPLLNLRSKRAITRKTKKWGHPYKYSPRFILLSRLSEETGMSIDEIREQLEEERAYILQHLQYFSQ